MQLIARIAALVPPPRMHRHRYFGVMAQPATRQTEPATTGEGTQIRKILDHIGVDSETGAHMAISQARASPCGMRAMRMPVRVLHPSLARQPTGMGRRKRPPTLRSISASTGDQAKR